MCRTQSVLALVVLYVGLAHSFSWDYVVTTDTTLEFYNETGLTHSEDFSYAIKYLTYDAVQNRLLFLDGKKTRNIDLHILNLSTMQHQSLFMKIINKPDDYIRSLAYDPVTELVFFSDSEGLFWFSLKPGHKNNLHGNRIIESSSAVFFNLAVDSCRGYLYWTYMNRTIERARFDGSDKETLQPNDPGSFDFSVIDQQTRKLYFISKYTNPNNGRTVYSLVQLSTESRDLNREHLDLVYSEEYLEYSSLKGLTVSKDHFYWMDQYKTSTTVWKFRKIDNENSLKSYTNDFLRPHNSIVANYEIEDQIRGVHNCEALMSKYSVLSPKITQSNNISLNVPANERLVCHNYCIQGNCNVIEGKAVCSCSAGYSGDRCEVNICQGYCLNDGECHLNERSEPVCQCRGDYRGERCAVSVLLMKCFQTVSILKDILNTDITPFALDYGVKSTCTK